MKTPHTHFPKNKRVRVTLRNGETVTGRFIERTARSVELHNYSIPTKRIFSMGFKSQRG